MYHKYLSGFPPVGIDHNMKKFIDIGANLTDKVFNGCYRGKQAHADDFHAVLLRAADIGMRKIIVTAGCLEDVNEALEITKNSDKLFFTVGVHPTRCNEFEKDGDSAGYLENLRSLISANKDKVVALGELGLDYDRTHFCSIETQKKYFEMQLDLAEETKLPLFLHSRNCPDDFTKIIEDNLKKISGGVVHSFTGSKEEAARYIELGLYIGINGCSLKTEENLRAMASIPTEFLMIETDAPWCGIKNSHAGSRHVTTKFDAKKKERWVEGCTVKDRTEPCHIIQVLEVMAAVRGEDPDELCEAMYQNTMKLFFPNEEA